MLAAARAINDVLGSPHVTGIALVGADRTVLKGRFEGADDDLGELGASARQIFKQASPPIRYLDLAFSGARLVLMPFGGAVVFLRPAAEAGPEQLTAVCEPHRQTFIAFESTPTRRPEAPVVPPQSAAPADFDVPIEATAQEVVDRLLETLGGPVVRNYVRKAQAGLRKDFPDVDSMQVDIRGQVTVSDFDHSPKMLRALGMLLGATVRRASAVVQDLDRSDPDVGAAGPEHPLIDAFRTARGT